MKTDNVKRVCDALFILICFMYGLVGLYAWVIFAVLEFVSDVLFNETYLGERDES